MLSDDTLLFVVDRPVDREPTPLATVDKPVEVDALSEESPVDAEVERLETPVLSDDTPVDSEPTLLATVDTEFDSELMPVEAEVESDDTPVLSDETPVLKLETPVLSDDTPVESDDTPVLSDEATVDRLEMPVDVLVETASTARFVAFSCEPLIASVESALTWPAATFVICRSASFAPTETTLAGVVPAYA
ncbi:hypothetical protein [Paraburkholderia sp. RAU2J]|uniref:hypothetical protein n=1 Tax=Paraburkholderia sp. RAU2J TaxID=1938810 RepID=UPI001F5446D8|nr:hypothetical protein [Paraburkholderia sp. RAU2J]